VRGEEASIYRMAMEESRCEAVSPGAGLSCSLFGSFTRRLDAYIDGIRGKIVL